MNDNNNDDLLWMHLRLERIAQVLPVVVLEVREERTALLFGCCAVSSKGGIIQP